MRAVPKFLLLSVLAGLSVPGTLAAQENIPTPRQKAKESVEKLGKAPELAAESPGGLKEAAKPKINPVSDAKAASKTKAEAGDLAISPKNVEQPAATRFSSEGKRDPFRPMTMRPRTSTRPRENLSPLERLELGQLKVVGIVWNAKEPTAMIEDTAGLGYIVKVGTPIGANDGKVKAIHAKEIVVEEFYADFYGAKKKRDVILRLLTE